VRDDGASQVRLKTADQQEHAVVETALDPGVVAFRLCLQLGRELALPWAAKLDPAQLPTGSDRRWVSRTDDGLLILKP
jgi:hypothetical protein